MLTCRSRKLFSSPRNYAHAPEMLVEQSILPSAPKVSREPPSQMLVTGMHNDQLDEANSRLHEGRLRWWVMRLEYFALAGNEP